MPRYVIERQYLLPVYQHLEVEAPDFETACHQAIDNEEWSGAIEDGDSARETTLTRAVELPAGYEPPPAFVGSTAAYALYQAGLDPLPIPAAFAGDEQTPEERRLRAELAELDAEPDDGPADVFADRRREILNRLDELR